MIMMPTNDNIIVKLPKEDKQVTTKSGIIIAKNSNSQSRPDRATVVAVGKGRILANGDILKPEVNKDDEVIFNRFAGTEILVGEDKYLIIKENDILAIIK